jgi:hypothetical protein
MLRPVLLTDASVENEPLPDDVDSALKDIFTLPRPEDAPDNWSEIRQRIRDLWEAVFSTYVVFGRLDAIPGSTVSITVSYTIPITADQIADPADPSNRRLLPRQRDESVVAFTKNHARFIFGLRPHVYRFHLQPVHATMSYHMRFDGYRDQYVYNVYVDRDAGAQGGTTTFTHLVASADPETSAHHYAHAYVRPLPSTRETEGKFIAHVEMREKPPGLLGLVALVAAVQFLLVAVVYVEYDKLFPDGDVAPLLVAVPGLIAAWLASQLTPTRLQRTPLATVAGIACTGAIALLATVVALFSGRGSEIGDLTLGDLTIAHPFWLGLVVFSAWNGANLGIRWWRNTSTFLGRLRRHPGLVRYEV